MNINKIYKLFLIVATIVFTLTIHSTCYADNEKITKDFELNSQSSSNNEIIYGCNIEKDGELKSLSINATEFNLPSNLYDYKDDIRMRVTYSEEDYKVYDCKVINYKTGELIKDLSEENINKLFNIEYGKNITEKSWSDKIKLSEINENVIYKYTASSTNQFPEIENDIGKNCIIYIKEKDDKTYERKINMSKNILGNGISASFNEYNLGESFCIMYKSLENNELLDLVKKDEIIYLSKYKDGDKLEYQFEKYIYNDTDKNITVNTKDTAFGVEDSKSVLIGKGEIYGFDWMIDESIISYEQGNTNDNQNSKTEENNSNNHITQIDNNDNSKKTENSKDSTTVNSSKLPQTGTSNIIIIMILISTIVMIIVAIKSREFKDIK